MAFKDVSPAKKEIASQRSFGQPITELAALIKVVSEFASRGAEKLMCHSGKAGHVLTFVHISTPPQYMNDQQHQRFVQRRCQARL